jgi:hypothetical protein
VAQADGLRVENRLDFFFVKSMSAQSCEDLRDLLARNMRNIRIDCQKRVNTLASFQKVLVLAERAGELFTSDGACGSDAGFEEALAAK